MGRITFPKFPPLDPDRPSIPKGYILPIHTSTPLPRKIQTAASKTSLAHWNPGIPTPDQDVTVEEADLFRAKSITLIRDSQLNCPVEKWIDIIQKTPIVKVVKEDDHGDTVTLQQMLPILQGILVEASFRRKSAHRFLSVPLQESFRLSKRPHEAHPFPHQHTGWALCEELFTPSSQLSAEKLHFITELTQNSSLAERVEQLAVDKQKAFQHMPRALLEKHRELACALEAASAVPSPPDVIENYFASLNEAEGWNHLTHLYEAVNSLLHKASIQQEIPLTLSASTSSVIAASALLQQPREQHPAERYTRWMVEILRQGAENPDTRFGKQLQEIYTFQLSYFLHEQQQTPSTPQDIAEQMIGALEKEIAILKNIDM